MAENQNFSEEEAIRGVLAQIHLDAPNPWGPMEEQNLSMIVMFKR